METADKIRYWTWCQDKYWQYQRRQEWAYEWRGDTLVRYHELVMPDPDFMKGLLEWLKLPESVHGFEEGGVKYAGCTMYNRQTEFEAEWKPVSAWYEQQEGQIDERTKLKIIRIFQALQRNPKDGKGDGPYVVENGCMYKVSHTFYWNVPELPEAPQSESGVSYRVGSVARDDETGLWSCYIERRERVMQEVPKYTSDNTDFAARTEQQFLGVKQDAVAGTGKKASAKGGVKVRRRLKKNEDCTSDITIETEIDKPVEKAMITKERSLRAETTVVEDRNMESPHPEGDLPPGTSIKNEKTEAGLWNRRKVEVKPMPPAGPIGESCTKTLFEHSHAKTEISAERPKSEVADVVLGDGEIVKTTVRQLEDTTFEKEEVTSRELRVDDAVTETRKTLRGVRKIRVNRGADEPASTEDMAIGDVVRNDKTPGGKYNQTIEKNENVPVGLIAEQKEETALESKHKTTENVAEKPECEAVQKEGVIEIAEVRATENGTYDVEKSVSTAKELVTENTGGNEIETETRKNVRNAKDVEIPKPETNKEVVVNLQKNEYGLQDGTIITREHKEKTVEYKSENALREVENELKINAEEAPESTCGEGEEVDVSVSINPHGSLTTQKRKVKHKPKEASVEWTTQDDNYEYTHKKVVVRNSATVPQPESGHYNATMSLSINDAGLYDAIISYVDRSDISSDNEGGSYETGTETKDYVFQKSDGSLYYRTITAQYKKRIEKGGNIHPDMLNGAVSGWGFVSQDNGRYAKVYTKITVGDEKEVGK